MSFVYVLIEYNKFNENEKECIHSAFYVREDAEKQMKLSNDWADKNSEQHYLKMEKVQFNQFSY